MTTLAATHPTLLDAIKKTGPDGKIMPVVEMLNQQNELWQDAVYVEANSVAGHRTAIRTGLPTASMKRYNLGVAPSKSRQVTITDAIGHIYETAEVDKDIAELNGNTSEFLLSEHLPHIEAMNQKASYLAIYGDETTNPDEFTGFMCRYNDQSAENACNILTSADTPDSSDNASILLVGWGPVTTFFTFPKGSSAGLDYRDYGLISTDNQGGSGLIGEVYRRIYDWKLGLVVRDWRYVVRIQIDLENVVKDAATGPDIPALMAKAVRRIPNLNICRPAFYMNRDMLDALDLQRTGRSTMAYQTIEDADGKIVDTFRKIPIRRNDAMLSTESGV
jgi:hypothetical protein